MNDFNLSSFIILIIIVILIILAIMYLHKNRSSCASCSSCNGDCSLAKKFKNDLNDSRKAMRKHKANS